MFGFVSVGLLREQADRFERERIALIERYERELQQERDRAFTLLFDERQRAADAEVRYHQLAEKQLRLVRRAIPQQGDPERRVQPAVVPADPEVVALEKIGDDVVQRMAQQLAKDMGVSHEAALAHARELAAAAEAMYA